MTFMDSDAFWIEMGTTHCSYTNYDVCIECQHVFSVDWLWINVKPSSKRRFFLRDRTQR